MCQLGESTLPNYYLVVVVVVIAVVVVRLLLLQNVRKTENRTFSIPGNNSGDFEELEERVKSLMEKSQNKIEGRGYAHLCKVCGKEGRDNAIKDHIEANHLEGIVIPCNLCDKTFRSRPSLRNHKSRHVTNNANMI